jgi:nucleoid-associated protein YgaU
MSRYKYTNINKKFSKKYYETTTYKKAIEKNSDSYFISQEGDRCDNLANRFYGDSTLWWFIAKVNNLTTNNIPAGTSLRIPSTTQDAEGY